MIEGIPNDKFEAAFIISIIAGIPVNWKKISRADVDCGVGKFEDVRMSCGFRGSRYEIYENVHSQPSGSSLLRRSTCDTHTQSNLLHG